ncbi:MAG: hypothetical protein WCO63_13350 [Bacteroidota bacterium]
MNTRTKSILLWIGAFVFMAVIAIYQKMTGPTYPVRGKVEFAGQTIKYKLLRTYETGEDAPISIAVSDTAVKGICKFRRFKSHDNWTESPMIRKGGDLVAYLPKQPMAGKVMYEISLTKGTERAELNNNDPVVLRYKGNVPLYILIPHIICMFLAMVFSTRAGLEAITKGTGTYRQALWTLIFLFIGGILLGPLVQKFAFDAYWTGWPWGHDLTDNKTAAAFLAWIIAVVRLKGHPERRTWAWIAALVLLAVYLIPHSALGSEIDYTKP